MMFDTDDFLEYLDEGDGSSFGDDLTDMDLSTWMYQTASTSRPSSKAKAKGRSKGKSRKVEGSQEGSSIRSTKRLIYAAGHNYRTNVAKLIKKGADVNGKDKGGQTALHWACKNGYELVVKKLLQSGADASITAPDGGTALHRAAEWNRVNLVALLLKLDSPAVTTEDNDGYTPLHWAAKNGHEQMVQTLLGHSKTDMNARDGNGDTPLNWAASENHVRVVTILVKHGAKLNIQNHDGDTALHWAALNGHADIVRPLLDHNADQLLQNDKAHIPLEVAYDEDHKNVICAMLGVNIERLSEYSFRPTVLQWVAVSENTQILDGLLAKGLNINENDGRGRGILHLAAHMNLEAMVKALRQRGADIQALDREKRNQPLHIAVSHKSPDSARALIDGGADVNAKNSESETPLHVAAYEDSPENVLLLVSKGGLVNAVDNDKRTPLHVAASRDNKKAAEVLINCGADVNLGDQFNNTPVHASAKKNSRSTSEVLVANRSSVTMTNDKGETPLHLCAKGNDIEHATLFIKSGADLDAQSKSLNTPLHMCATFNSDRLARLLVFKGADVTVKNGETETPLDIASRYKTGPQPMATARILVGLTDYWDMDEKESFQPIHWAAAGDHVDLLSVTLAGKGTADINTRDAKGRTPLHVAAFTGSIKSSAMLIKHGADVTLWDHDSQTPLELAISEKNVQAARLIVGLDETWEMDGMDSFSPLHWAAAADHLELAKGLRTHVNEVDELRRTPLHVSAENNSWKVAQVLCGRDADLRRQNSNGEPPLHIAYVYNSRRVFEDILMKKDPTVVDKEQNTILHLAARHNDTSLIDELECKYLSVDQKNRSGDTALHIAVAEENVEATRKLLEKGADVSLKNKNGLAPEDLAREKWQMLYMLLEAGAEKQAMENLGMLEKKLQCTQSLDYQDHSESGPPATELTTQRDHVHFDVNKVDDLGRTPMHWAAKGNRVASAGLLLQVGGRADVVTEDHKSPLHLALQVKVHSKPDRDDNEQLIRLLVNGLHKQVEPKKTAQIAASAVSSLIMSDNQVHRSAKITCVSSSLQDKRQFYGRLCYISNQVQGESKCVSEIWSKQTVLSALMRLLEPDQLEKAIETIDYESINSSNFLKQNALHLLADMPHKAADAPKIAHVLVNARIEIDCKDVNGENALHAACRHGCLTLAIFLAKRYVEKGMPLHDQDNLGRTPLHYLLRVQNTGRQHQEIHQLLELMRDSRVDLSQVDCVGTSILEMAHAQQAWELVYPDLEKIPGLVLKTKEFQEEVMVGAEKLQILHERKLDGWVASRKKRYPDPVAFVEKHLTSKTEGPVEEDKENIAIAGKIHNLVTYLWRATIEAMGFKYRGDEVQLSGSTSEGTKVGQLDEMDYNLYVRQWQEEWALTGIHHDPGGHIFAKLTTPEGPVISAEEQAVTVLDMFVDVAKQLETSTNFGLAVDDIKRNKLKVFTLVLRAPGRAKDVKITVDLVPTIIKDLAYNKSWSPTVNVVSQVVADEELLACPLLLKKDGYEISFSEKEHNAIRIMNSHAKNGYMLLKIMRSENVCPRLSCMRADMDIDDVVTSYIFKMAVLWVVDPEGKRADCDDLKGVRVELPREDSGEYEAARQVALQILTVLLHDKTETVPSYFCPSSKLRLTHSCRLLCNVMRRVLE